MTQRVAGGRLGAALLAYVFAATLVVTLIPFRFAAPARYTLTWAGGWRDILANIALFIPLGFLFRFARPAGWLPVVAAVILALVASAAIETTQLYEPGRVASALDVATDGAGALIGVLAFDYLARRAGRGLTLVGRVGLQLPLMGLVYLLVPLLWLDALGAGKSQAVWLSALLGVIGAFIIGAVQREMFSPARIFRPWETALLAALWFALSAHPVFWYQPASAGAAAGVIGIIVLALGMKPARRRPAVKRFEVPVIRWTLPLYLGYMMMLAVWPPAEEVRSWSLSLGLDRSVASAGTLAILRLLEYVAAFTLLGYMVAELGSRWEEPASKVATRVLVVSVPLAALLEVLRAFHPDYGASIALFAGIIGASLYGAMVYHLARAHARELREASEMLDPGRRPSSASGELQAVQD